MRKALLVFCFTSVIAAVAQNIQVSPANKTIAITAEESATVEADIADVSIGCQSYGPTHKEAYDANVRLSDQLLKALLASGVKQDAIRSENIAVQETDVEEKWPAAQKRQRKYYAHQSWIITAPASEAPKVVDLALANGGNRVEAVKWSYSRRNELQASAGAAALVRARTIADQMAKGLGARLGGLIYASNQVAVHSLPLNGRNIYTLVSLTPGAAASSAPPPLRLFPETIKESATVYAVFAIE